MADKNEERDVYFIPPNFLTGGRLFGGSIRMRNAVEAGFLVLITGIPLFRLPFPLMTRIILLCLITLPLGIFGIAGFEGVSLSEFAMNWVKWLSHRRTLYRSDSEPEIRIRTAKRRQPRNPAPTQRHAPPQALGIKVKTQEKTLLPPLLRLKRRSDPGGPYEDSRSGNRVPQTADEFIPVKCYPMLHKTTLTVTYQEDTASDEMKALKHEVEEKQAVLQKRRDLLPKL